MKHIGTVQLESDRLILRRFKKEDSQAMFNNWTSDEKATEFLRWQTHTDISIAEYLINDWLKRYNNDDFYQWAIVPKHLNEPIGIISVVEIKEKTETACMGYCIGSKWWHQGYTSEALSRVIDFVFNEAQFKRIEAQHDPNNPNSGKVMEKCGLKREGVLKNADWSNKGIIDACVHGIIAEDYLNKVQGDIK